MLYLDTLEPFARAVRTAADAAAVYGPREDQNGRYIAASPFGDWRVVNDPTWPLNWSPHYVDAMARVWPWSDLEPCCDCGRLVFDHAPDADGRTVSHVDGRPAACHMGGYRGD